MFGHNEIVGRKYFKEHGDKLLVTSVFYTLQGEGPFAGRPAVFVRLAKCNLACAFCDTYFDHGTWMTRFELFDTMAEAVNKAKHGKPHEGWLSDIVVVITGGEPLLQGEALGNFLIMCGGLFQEVQIESNGLFKPELPLSTTLVVSPKCADRSTEHSYLKPLRETLDRANCLKFVVTADVTSPYHTIPKWAFEWHAKVRRPVYVSPMAEYKRQPLRGWCPRCGGSGFTGPETSYDGVCSECGGQQRVNEVDIEDMAQRNKAERVSFWEPGLLDLTKVRANHEYAAAYAMEHGLRLSMQMQLFASVP